MAKKSRGTRMAAAVKRAAKKPAGALLGSARVAVARGRAVEAARAYRVLADNWSAADVTLPALSEVRRGARQ